MRYRKQSLVVLSIVLAVSLTLCTKEQIDRLRPDSPLVKDGREIFRFDTFGDEEFWSELLHIDKAIAGQKMVVSVPV